MLRLRAHPVRDRGKLSHDDRGVRIKPLPILWKRLVDKGETCPRCGSTERNVAAAVAKLESALQPLGIHPVLETRAIDDATFRAAPVESNRIWIGGKPMEEWLGAQAGKVDEVSAHVAASAVELSSLGESFGHGVELFTASNEKLMDSLQRIEGAIGQSMSRSDEQLAYYVAQAREVIDLSISSQQGIVEDLRRLNGQMAAAVQGVAA